MANLLTLSTKVKHTDNEIQTEKSLQQEFRLLLPENKLELSLKISTFKRH